MLADLKGMDPDLAHAVADVLGLKAAVVITNLPHKVLRARPDGQVDRCIPNLQPLF
ncbi:hypothetical protein MPLA_1590015 [Mesorhizobium sp. ORS 3359]|nr:hypothetical protein MPLA_1590015 [Mesorhizobium sp. ORS 3359]